MVNFACNQTKFDCGQPVAEPERRRHAAKFGALRLAQIAQRRLDPVNREDVELAGRAILGLFPVAQCLEQAPVGITHLYAHRTVIPFRIAVQACRLAEV